MSHFHTLPDGTRTGLDIADPVNPGNHWHSVGSENTSVDEFGTSHTHTFKGVETSGPIQENLKGVANMPSEKKEFTTLSLNVSEIKEQKSDGSNIGVFSGHLAAFAKDRMDDVFLPGAFSGSIARHQKEGRPIRMLIQHDTDFLVGGFPIESVREDEKGLFVVGNINLDVQRGREAFSLMKQGVLTDMSIGFSVFSESGVEFRDGIRFLKEVEIWEGSLVTEPANPAAQISEVKSVVPFQDLPLASRDRAWDGDAAVARVREFTNSDDIPSSSYRQAFLWYDRDNADEFGAYKLPVADVVDGRLVAVPRGIFAAAAAIQGARGGVDIPESDRAGVIRHIERYYAKMGLDSPFKEDEKQYFVGEDVKSWTERDIERFLKATGMMSKSAAKLLSNRLDVKQKQNDNDSQGDLSELLSEVKALTSCLK